MVTRQNGAQKAIALEIFERGKCSRGLKEALAQIDSWNVLTRTYYRQKAPLIGMKPRDGSHSVF